MGQITQMNVWEDDQALFFKLAHIQAPAGFFGPGPFGLPPYKYAATPFIPIYTFFGLNPTAFFTYLLVVYLITTIVIYKTFKFILGENGGKVTAFFFACSYITSEAFFRMANSMTTNLSIILACLILASYWKFFKTQKYIYYFLSVFLFFLSLEFAMSRMHYFFAVIILFELIFLTFKNTWRSIIPSLLRLLPPALVFYNYLIIGGDHRTGNVVDTARSLLQGQFFLLYGFFASFNNLILPDWFIKIFFYSNQPKIIISGKYIPVFILVLVLLVCSVFGLILKRFKRARFLLPIFFILNIGLFIYLHEIFSTPLLYITTASDAYRGALGGVILTLAFLTLSVIKQKKLYLFFLLWLLGNLAAYSAYTPTVGYTTVERYAAHSFFALVAIAGLIFSSLPINRQGGVGLFLVIFLGLGNAYNSYLYQKNIVQNRSLPTKAFFADFKKYIPNLKAGDIVFIDVDKDARHIYKDSIGAAMMPDTTAFAWRYNIDRYDFKLTSDFNDFVKLATESGKMSQIHSFWYSKQGLVDTTLDLSSYLTKNLNLTQPQTDLPKISKIEIKKNEEKSFYSQGDILINFKEPVKSSIPIRLSLELVANFFLDKITFPLIKKDSREEDVILWSDPSLRELAFGYQREKQDFYQSSSFEVSSEWNERKRENLFDKDPNTAWQSDRIKWDNNLSFIKIKLSSVQIIDRIAWINGFALTTPTNITIQSSIDGVNWEDLTNFKSIKKIEDNEIRIIDFKPTQTEYLRILITETITGDSPAIAEIWPIQSKFSKLNIQEAERFIKDPFLTIPNYRIYLDSLDSIASIGKAHIYWEKNSSSGWQTTVDALIPIIYDSKVHQYQVKIPPGGTQILKLLISNITIPGELEVKNIKIEPFYD